MPQAEGVRMSYDEWWALPEHPRTEWVDGEVIVMADPHPDHSMAQGNLPVALKQGLPDLKVYPVVAVRLPRNRVRVPDISVLTERPTTNPVELTPVLVVEVLSPAPERSTSSASPGSTPGPASGSTGWSTRPSGESRCSAWSRTSGSPC